MFIRECYRKIKGKKKYSYLVLAESIRTEKGPRQRVILSLGNIKVAKKFWSLLAEMIKRRLAGQEPIFAEPEELVEIADRAFERIRLKRGAKEGLREDKITTTADGIKVEKPRILGPVNVAWHFSQSFRHGGYIQKVWFL